MDFNFNNNQERVKIYSIFNFFYDKYNISSYEERMYRKGGKYAYNIVKGYKQGKKAILDYIKDKNVLDLSDDELKEVFQNAYDKIVKLDNFKK